MNNEVVLHRIPHRTLAFLAGCQQTFARHVAQSARRDVGDAQQTGIIIWIDERFHVREEIANLAAIKKTLTADEVIAHLRLAQRGFQRPRLHIGAEQNRVVTPRNAAGHAVKFNLAHNRLGLLLFIPEGMKPD